MFRPKLSCMCGCRGVACVDMDMDVLRATMKLLSDLSIHEVRVGDGEYGVGHLPALIVLVLTRGDLGALGERHHLNNTS